MLNSRQELWTDQKVESTVTAHYVYSHLRAEDADKLTLRVFSTFSDDTYLQWILANAKRLFLTLVDSRIAEQIFRLTDESYDDDDLPLPEDAIPALRLPQGRTSGVDQVFYRSQFKYICRTLEKLEHIRYAKAEAVPFQVTGIKPGSVTGFSDRIILPSKQPQILLRKTISLTEDKDEIDLLAEVASLHMLTHPHLLGIFASYSQEHSFHILLQPAASSSLHSFLSSQPKSFEDIPKPERRAKLFNWIACLSSALAWLHSNKVIHGAIRPSRILISDDFQPILGQLEGDSVLGCLTAKNDLEAYQYSAPEFWKRELTYQSNAIMQTHSSFIARHNSTKIYRDHESDISSKRGTANSNGHENVSYAFSPVSKGNSSRLKLAPYNRRTSISIPERDTESRMSVRPTTVKEDKRGFPNLGKRFDTLSIKSSNSSENASKSGGTRSLYFIPANKKAAIVQTWKSSVQDRSATDIFSLSAIIMDILTIACGRTSSTFIKHRSAKNRQAGRGGGVADASFHANLPQVASWAETLHKDADKKIKKDRGSIFQAVGPILQVVIQCLDREPQKRMASSTLARRMTRHLTDFAGLSATHCSLQLLEDRADEMKARNALSTAPINETNTNRGQINSRQERDLDDYDLEQSGPSSYIPRYPTQQDSGQSSPVESSSSSHILVLDHLDRASSRQFIRAHMDQHIPPRSQSRVFIQEYEDDSPPSLYSHATSTKYTESEPRTPITTTSTYKSSLNTSPFSQSEYRPPDRNLPPVPSIPDQRRMRNNVQTTPKNRKVVSKQPMNVGEATDMLQTINSKRDTQTQPKLNLQTQLMKDREFPQIILEDEDESEPHFAVQSRMNRNTDFVHGHGMRFDSRAHRR